MKKEPFSLNPLIFNICNWRTKPDNAVFDGKQRDVVLLERPGKQIYFFSFRDVYKFLPAPPSFSNHIFAQVSFSFFPFFFPLSLFPLLFLRLLFIFFPSHPKSHILTRKCITLFSFLLNNLLPDFLAKQMKDHYNKRKLSIYRKSPKDLEILIFFFLSTGPKD